MRYVAIDIETSAKWPTAAAKIFCVAICYSNGKIEVIEKPTAAFKALMADKSTTKIIHNAGFDLFWLLMKWDIYAVNVWDTMLMEQIIIGDNPTVNAPEFVKEEISAALVYTLSRYGLAELENKKEDSMGAKFLTRNINAPLTKEEINYVKNDVRYLHELQKMQEVRLNKLGLTRLANLENGFVVKLVEMRARGVMLDIKKWKSIAVQNQIRYNELIKRLPAVVDNWNSPQQVKRYFNSIGIPVGSLTDIEELKDTYNNKTLNQFIEARGMYKSVTTYGTTWLDDDIKGSTVDPDGRVRADYRQIVNSGRLSCSHPNLQQLPREGEHRSAFVPSKGNVFVVGDFSGQEIGIMAAASKEEMWIKAMLRRDDIHGLTASLLYGPEWDAAKETGCTFPKKCKCSDHNRMRHNAKTINFAIAYGSGPGNIAKKLGISNKDAIRLLDKYKKVVPRVTKWLSRNAAETVKTRISYSADIFKRRRTLRDPEDWMLSNIGKNNPVQSCGANMIKLAMVSMSKNVPIVLTIHDELIAEVKKADAKKCLAELKAVMEKAADYCTDIPGLIEVEPKIMLNLQKK